MRGSRERRADRCVVVEPVAVTEKARAQEAVRRLIAVGLVRAFETDGVVKAIGRPGRSAFLTRQAATRAERLEAGRARERGEA